MKGYCSAVAAILKDWKKAVLVIVFTVARIIYGLAWLKAGWHKLEWLHDGELNAIGMINGVVAKISGPEVTRFDPLGINKAFGWIADTFFAGMPAITDVLVVAFEIGIGVLLIIGFKIFITALVATFLNLQFMAGGSSNNFGYIWTNLALMKFAKYAEVIGLDGFLRFKKGKELV
jgi:thiosulfate dehydrogenase [quinone] large subunit